MTAEADQVDVVELVTVGPSSTRFFTPRHGPPFRGTHVVVVYTTGSIPFYETYPGPYVPQPRATAFGVIVTPRQPRLASSSTAQISDSAEISPGKRPMIVVRRRTSTNVRSKRFVLLVRLRCSSGKRRCATSWSTCSSIVLIADG